MFERLKEWFGSFKNKVTTAMSVIGGIATAALALPLPIPAWARIGLTAVAVAAPVVSTTYATVKYVKNRKNHDVTTASLVDTLVSSEDDATVSNNPEVAQEKKELVAACVAENREEAKEAKAAESNREAALNAVLASESEETKTDRNTVVNSLVAEEAPEKAVDTKAATKAMVHNLVSDDSRIAMTDEEKEAAIEALSDAAGLTDGDESVKKPKTLNRKQRREKYGRNFKKVESKASKANTKKTSVGDIYRQNKNIQNLVNFVAEHQTNNNRIPSSLVFNL